MKKFCPKCNTMLLLSEFYKSSKKSFGRNDKCKKCEKNYKQTLEAKKSQKQYDFNRREQKTIFDKEYNERYSTAYPSTALLKFIAPATTGPP